MTYQWEWLSDLAVIPAWECCGFEFLTASAMCFWYV